MLEVRRDVEYLFGEAVSEVLAALVYDWCLRLAVILVPVHQ